MPEQRIADYLPGWIKDHLQRYIESDGADGHLWDASLGGGEGMIPTLLLTTTGRKSGLSLTLPLIYSKTDTGYCVIASRGGAPTHPAWFLNLQDNPEVTVQTGKTRFKAIAEQVTGQEKEALWKVVTDINKHQTQYRATTERDIPLVFFRKI